MVVDDELVRIGSAKLLGDRWLWTVNVMWPSKPAVMPRVRDGIRQIRDRLVAEHLGLEPDAVAHGVERAGSLRAFIDARTQADHTLARIELASDEHEEPSEALRAAADPDQPILSGSLVADLVPPARDNDSWLARRGRRHEPLARPAIAGRYCRRLRARTRFRALWSRCSGRCSWRRSDTPSAGPLELPDFPAG